MTGDQVTFRTKGEGTETVPPVEFLRRFVQHVLPDKFKKIRHAGLYASPKALAKARACLESEPLPIPPSRTWQEELMEVTGRDVTRCSVCGGALFPEHLKPTLSGSRREPCRRRTRSPP